MAVYTNIPDNELVRFMEQYDIGAPLSIKGIAEGVENSNYLLRTQAGQYILTLYEKRVQAEDLPYFLGLMRHLVRKGFTCPEPIATRAGEMVSICSGRPAAIVRFLDGIWLNAPGMGHCRALGRGMAEMHRLAADFTMIRINALGPMGWRNLRDRIGERAQEIHIDLPALLDDELGFLDKAWPRDLPTGQIHADLFPDNVFFLGERLSGFIDFYFACTDFLAYDLAVALNAWCFENGDIYCPERGAALVDAYHAARPLRPEERSALPVLARGAALRFLLTRAYDWLNPQRDALVQPKNPMEYMHKLVAFREKPAVTASSRA
ncbi:MAG TPA: homoserine kinase [Dongiaceae bacterium]|jgi:homoserine kinase type II|nr:homoserine kinase [Dongiaceae bacterium]